MSFVIITWIRSREPGQHGEAYNKTLYSVCSFDSSIYAKLGLAPDTDK